MKKIFVIIALFYCVGANAQVQELEQLSLDLTKLSQLKSILDNMYKGYTVLTKGYNTIKNVSQGNFQLHEVFLNSLLAVSPTVRNYKKIVDIITAQFQIVSEYKTAFSKFRGLSIFSGNELDNISSTYQNIFNRSVQNLDDLLMVITANKLRMSDAERLTAIDRIHADMNGSLGSLRSFNSRTSVLAGQRQKMLNDNVTLQNIYGIQK